MGFIIMNLVFSNIHWSRDNILRFNTFSLPLRMYAASEPTPWAVRQPVRISDGDLHKERSRVAALVSRARNLSFRRTNLRPLLLRMLDLSFCRMCLIRCYKTLNIHVHYKILNIHVHHKILNKNRQILSIHHKLFGPTSHNFKYTSLDFRIKQRFTLLGSCDTFFSLMLQVL